MEIMFDGATRILCAKALFGFTKLISTRPYSNGSWGLQKVFLSFCFTPGSLLETSSVFSPFVEYF